MANKNGLALATIAIAIAAMQPMNAELITEIAGRFGIDEDSVINIANEVMAAKDVAESDMKLNIKSL
ncbi:hypothetical protein [Parabacteroides sp.]|jgi:hypothetical protein